MVKGKPVKITKVAENAYSGPTPKPLLHVGELPVPAPTPTTLTAVPASFADVAAVKTYLDTLVGELKGSPYFD